ncbi:Ribonuclease/ribotoxin [Triangularia setosa]|uniref:Ribonuclease/ribotoxin n=1 Tax=Triangularia setosa TaxID=2587417 RepID=A0AAN7A5P2_9PEZI|nr:Ribonuclease/ribotoxin [Podospora setosa]
MCGVKVHSVSLYPMCETGSGVAQLEVDDRRVLIANSRALTPGAKGQLEKAHLVQDDQALPVIASPLISQGSTATREKITPSNWTCGTHAHASWDAGQAVSLGYSLLKASEYDGKYPHEFVNREGFNFDTDPPYYEYPIIPGGPYTAGSLGPDRVIFDLNGMLDGLITHTGVSGNGLVACTEKVISA